MSHPATSSAPLTLITGGARAGKSTYALRCVAAADQVRFIATAQAFDDEMRTRIARHSAERPPHWETVEEPLDLAAAIGATPARTTIIVDCLTLWTSNLLLQVWPDDAGAPLAEWTPDAALQALVEVLHHRRTQTNAAATILVTNEVGLGVIPATPMGRIYRDALGRVNQRVAAIADDLVLLVSGVPLAIKGRVR